ncbi:MAG: methyl-accepting chemotaxis protein [Lachnospiraceae bacterium]|nr:methyl-accepting chemotaxis protein [Lachnospiraceae bacterium]
MGEAKKQTRMQTAQEGSAFKGSIKKKMLTRTITPTVAGLLIAAVLIAIIAGVQIKSLEDQNIKNCSLNAAYQISEYFTKYMEVSRQLGANQELADLFEQVQAGSPIDQAEQYASVIATMTNMHNTDADNILVCWAADVDSSQCIEDSGYVSTIGEWDITTRSWYAQVLEAGTTIVTEPYENSSTGEMVASIVTPVYDGSGNMAGVAALDLSLGAVVDMMEEQKLGDTGFLLLMTKEGMVMFADDAGILQTSIQEIDIADNVKQGFAEDEYGSYVYRYAGNKNYGYMEQAGDSRWVVLSGMPNLEYNMDLYKVIGATILLFGIMIAVMCVVISRIAMGIVRPVHQLHHVAERIAGGDLDVELEVESDDEIGAVAAAIDKTVIRLKDYIKYIDEIAEVLGEIAQGNLLFTLKQDYAGEFGKIKDALENISRTLTQTIRGIHSTAEQVSSGAGQIAQAAQSLADGATSQASAVEELFATVTDISERVRENADYAAGAADGADEVRKNIESSNEDMRLLVKAMEEINECSNAISAIIANIEEIADQTNLLSLNASIEAARAGEMGRGFAVVANEVGNLAKESVSAVQKSTDLIQNSIDAVERGMNLVNETAGKLAESVAGVVGLADKMNELSEAAHGQTVSLNEVEQGIHQISAVVSDNSAMAEESAASSEELSAEATALNDMMQIFVVE